MLTSSPVVFVIEALCLDGVDRPLTMGSSFAVAACWTPGNVLISEHDRKWHVQGALGQFSHRQESYLLCQHCLNACSGTKHICTDLGSEIGSPVSAEACSCWAVVLENQFFCRRLYLGHKHTHTHTHTHTRMHARTHTPTRRLQHVQVS